MTNLDLPLTETAPLPDWADLAHRAAAAVVVGTSDARNTGDNSFDEFAVLVGAHDYGVLAWPMNSAWRLLPGFTSSLADISQTSDELDLLSELTAPLAVAAGRTSLDATVWARNIDVAVGNGAGDLSAAADLCARVSDVLSAGAATLAERDQDDEMANISEMYRLRAECYRRGPDENGRYLPDELLLYDLRAEWFADER